MNIIIIYSDESRPSDKGGGVGGGHPDPEIMEGPGLKKFFWKIRGGGGEGAPRAPPLDQPLIYYNASGQTFYHGSSLFPFTREWY